MIIQYNGSFPNYTYKCFHEKFRTHIILKRFEVWWCCNLSLPYNLNLAEKQQEATNNFRIGYAYKNMSAKLHPIYLSEKKMFKLNAKFYNMVFAQIIRFRANKRRNNKYKLNLSFFTLYFLFLHLLQFQFKSTKDMK